MKYIVKVGFWDVKEDKERTETYTINKAKDKEDAEKKALSRAMTAFAKRVAGVDPFFVEQTLELHNGKAIVVEFESTVEVCIPGNGGHGIMKDALEAVNLYRMGRLLTMEDGEETFGKEPWQELQRVHSSMHRHQSVPILVKVTEDGQLVVSTRFPRGEKDA